MRTNPLYIKNLTLKNNVLAAPLAGVSDVGFRSVCRIMGASLGFTEMISAKGLLYNNKNTQKLLITSEYEDPCGVQLFGSEAEIMAEACRNPFIEKFDIIDINMGCPVPKVFDHGEGAALMSDIRKASEIITACVKAVNKPVTVKFRKGIDENSVNAVEFAKMCEDSGASLITVHGRLKTQMYSGKSDRNIIADVVKAVKIPVIANGDIYCDDDAQEIINQTGAAGVMVARGSLGNPALFAEITGIQPVLSVKDAIIMHAGILNRYMGEKYTSLNMRKHLLWYLKKAKSLKQYRAEANAVKSLSDIYNLVNKAF
jgi:nifR3 family TIM-barrel protein